MKTMKRIVVILLLLAGGVAGGVNAAAALTCRVSPDEIPITLGYHGTTLTISGESRAGDDLIVRISSANSEAHYKYIGKAGGVVWMKKGDISFKNVPGVYMLYTTRDLEHLLSTAEQKANLIGYEGLKEASEVIGEDEEITRDPKRWMDEFFKFKEKENLYTIQTGTVTRRHGQSSDSYEVQVAWPFQAATGEYTVEALAVRDGKIVERAGATFTVKRAGLVKKITDLAFNHAALYGIMAIVIAIVAGFAVGIIFKGGDGAH